MDRISRRLTNIKQDKVSVSNIQPSLQSLREGQEILYQPKNKPLRRYRREGHVLWYSDMTKDGNKYVDKNICHGYDSDNCNSPCSFELNKCLLTIKKISLITNNIS